VRLRPSTEPALSTFSICGTFTADAKSKRSGNGEGKGGMGERWEEGERD